MMKPEIKTKWVEALRSGKYKQGFPIAEKHYPVNMGLIDRISSKISLSDECWIWTGAINSYGYGVVGIFYKTVQVPRIVYFLEHPDEAIGHNCVCHRCDNPLCVNPSHLFLGTKAENNADRSSKGRGKLQNGSSNSMSKLTEADIPAIRDMYRNGIYQAEIGKKYGVTQTMIGRIVRGEAWIHA